MENPKSESPKSETTPNDEIRRDAEACPQIAQIGADFLMLRF